VDCTGFGEAVGDAWLLNTTNFTWTRLEAAGEAPSARTGHVGFVRWAALFLHGGREQLSSYENLGTFPGVDEIWRLMTATGAYTRLDAQSAGGDSPSARGRHTMTVVGQQIFLYGGLGSGDGE
jgi:hypothetical protein